MSGAATKAGAPAGDQDWKPKGNPWLIAIVVTLAAFMEILDTTIVNVSLPHIAGDLSTSYNDAAWALTSYLAANGIVLTISGWLGRRLGRKRYFLICIVMFTVFSFLCGVATSLPQLIVFRLFQGLFGGGLQPNQQSIILDTFPPAKRGGAFAITAIATIVAPVLGPTLGGYITDNFSWRWVFFLNVPVGIFAALAVSALVEDPPWARMRKTPVDLIGLSLITIGLGCLEVMMDRGEDDDWFGSTFICVLAVLSVAGILGAVGWLLTTKRPAVDLRVLGDRNFAIGAMLIGVVGIVLYASAVLVPQFAQQVVGYTATLAGLILSPGGLGIIVLIPLVNIAMKHVETRYIIATGFTIMGASLVYSSHLILQIDFKHLVMFRLAQTAALGFLFVPISTIAYRTLPREMNGDASALFSMFRNVFGAIGIAMSTSLITQRTQVREAHMTHWMTPFYQPYNEYIHRSEMLLQRLGRPPASIHAGAQHQIYQQFVRQATVLAYNDCFLLFSLIAFAVVPFCFLLKPGVSGGKPAAK
ncbi:DHA2 family efflux MFS transporter permease subunit [Lichenicola cladoniae]|uniref:DHA2 family efflux MFS transporter permease subunit n=1 Tax=Lichenicola cladoniae TaxID=1484109 RepID=A0A6M8HMF5_9PROT|nr:DHA2 family efflux MFS transporter permease subunit [Lichenicola cladoniae]NPD67035.1 DHA2 family efflux MFS transporter permease subunit [Acetobacteraceae bacterium]QKE89579.1 DHA2 family efflux MFS transporter permease subunit [Lichenicola cladoniae]